uniref:Uncharacterized protein n=1 Tax=Anguilla anguilla TaxID=7936 RepID=A0A0E9RPN6_ANGAN
MYLLFSHLIAIILYYYIAT